MRADIPRLQDIFDRMIAAQTQPDYESIYHKLAAEAREACGDEPEQQEFLEALIPYEPEMVAWRQNEARKRNTSAAARLRIDLS